MFTKFKKFLDEKIFLKYPTLKKMTKFGIVGFWGTLIDMGVLNFLVIFLLFNVYFSASISFVVAVINNFLLNKYWTFSGYKQKNSVKKQFVQFFTVSLIALGLNLIVMYVLIEYAHLWYNFAKISAVGVVFFWNFFANKVWTFKQQNQEQNLEQIVEN